MSEVDIVAEISQIDGAAPFPDLDNTWFWAIANGRFTFTAALSSDGRSLFQVHARGGYAAAVVRDTLSFVRHHEAAMLAAAPMTHVAGFDAAGHGFDSVAAVIPAVAELNTRIPALTPVTYAVFPGWACEFSGAETEPETYTRMRQLDFADLGRKPVPFLKMRFNNTQAHTIGDERLLTEPDFLYGELAGMEGNAKAWIEAENFRAEIRRITWDEDGYLVGDAGPRRSREEIEAWARRYLSEGDS